MTWAMQNFDEQGVNPSTMFKELRNSLNFNLTLKLLGWVTTWISYLDNPEGI